jgi:hypothetical protein
MELATGIPTVETIQTGPTIFAVFCRTFKDVRLVDPPLIALYSILAIWFGLLLYFRKSLAKSTFLFGTACVVIGLTPDINSYMRANWQNFRFSANYFDRTQFFIFLFLDAPLLAEVLIFLLLLVIELFNETQRNGLVEHLLMRLKQKLCSHQ